MAITPFNVTNFGTNRKLIGHFLLVDNTNLHPILQWYNFLHIIGQIFAFDSGFLSLTHSFWMNP